MLKKVGWILFAVLTVICFFYAVFYISSNDLWANAVTAESALPVFKFQMAMVLYTFIGMLLSRSDWPFKLVIYLFIVLLVTNIYHEIPSYVFEYSLLTMLLSIFWLAVIKSALMLLWFCVGLSLCGVLGSVFADFVYG